MKTLEFSIRIPFSLASGSHQVLYKEVRLNRRAVLSRPNNHIKYISNIDLSHRTMEYLVKRLVDTRQIKKERHACDMDL